MVYKKFISLLLIFMLIGGQAQTSMAGFQENSTEVSHAEEEPAADSAGAGGANDNEEVSDVHTEEEESIKEETPDIEEEESTEAETSESGKTESAEKEDTE
ncbi:hypothetical protein, partial [Lacrimispora sp.]